MRFSQTAASGAGMPWTPAQRAGGARRAAPRLGRPSRLGPVEQLVLRGDGLTTTSLEILTGHVVTVRVRRHWRMRLPENGEPEPTTFDGYAGFGTDMLAAFVSVGYQDLDSEAGSELLIREVLLCGDDGVSYAMATVFAVLDRLPAEVAHKLATTGDPIGRLLVAANIHVKRELRAWGLFRVGDFAAHLGPEVSPDSRVPARAYTMRSIATGKPITLITEWFAPRLFDLT